MNASDVYSSIGIIDRIIGIFSKPRRLFNYALMATDRTEKKKYLEEAKTLKHSKRLNTLIDEVLTAIYEAEKEENRVLF